MENEALVEIREGNVVLNLGVGDGSDSFSAREKVGKDGLVIGVDFVKGIVEKARDLAKKRGFDDVDFRLGDIEDLPVESNSVDVVIADSVLGLALSKKKVFSEAYQVLKKGGKMFVFDSVSLKGEYIEAAKGVGFEVEILDEDDEEMSLKFIKPKAVESKCNYCCRGKC